MPHKVPNKDHPHDKMRDPDGADELWWLKKWVRLGCSQASMVEDIQYDSLDTGISKGTHSDSMTISTITFNQFRDVIMVVYAGIVHDNHTTRSGIWCHEGQLIAKHTAQNEHITNERTCYGYAGRPAHSLLFFIWFSTCVVT
jgi:hypothetical protein